MAPLPVFGRDQELRVLDALVDRAPEHGGALVVRGEAGIGKSALLAAAGRGARERGLVVLSASGVQSEAHLPFSGLHQILRPVLAGVDELAPRQRTAILAAFVMTEGAAPDLFLITLAALELLSGAAARSPLLLSVDDVQWLDRSTVDVLAFVARRLTTEPVVLLAASRDEYENALTAIGLPELRLTELDETAAGALLDSHAPAVAPAVRARLLDEAAGNPLALVELPLALGAKRLGGGAALPAWLPLTTRLERVFAARVSELSAGSRTLLLVAAVDGGGVLTEVRAAAGALLGGDAAATDALEPAVAAGLVEVDGVELRFRHPLVRSAVHQRASAPQRRAAHTALAAVLAGHLDRRAWHLAAASTGPNEAVAAALEAAAARALQRGAIVVAVGALERAATLSGDTAGRGRRLLRAAGLAYDLGRRDLAVRLLREAEPLEVGRRERGRLTWLRETLAPRAGADASAVLTLVETAEQAGAEGDGDLALDVLWLVASRYLWSDPDQDVRATVVAAAERLGTLDDARVLAILAYAAPVARGAVVIEHLARLRPDEIADSDALNLLATAATVVGAFDLAAEYLAAAVARMRAHGRLGHLARVLVLQAWVATHHADWDLAPTAAEEGHRLALETGEFVWAGGALAVEAMLAGLRGQEDDAAALAAEAERMVRPFGARFVLASVQMARGIASLGGGRHAEAYAELRRLYDPADPAHHHSMKGRSIGDLADAAVRCGRREEARTLMEEVGRLAEQTPSPWF